MIKGRSVTTWLCMRYQFSWILTGCIAITACPADPPTDDSATAATTQSSGESGTTHSASETETTQGTTTVGATGSSSSGIDPTATPSDCDALPDEAACTAVQGSDFACTWVSGISPVELDGGTCTLGEPVGRCVAEYDYETGCLDDSTNLHPCPGGDVPFVFVREVEGGPTLVYQGFGGASFSCGAPPMWLPCDGAGSHPACECACDPGLPE